jgi:hypothetical protein
MTFQHHDVFQRTPTICMDLVLEAPSDDIGYLSTERYPELKKLNIIGFSGRSFAEHSVRSPVVEDLVLTDCVNLVSLQGIEEFTSLKRLWLSNCPLLEIRMDINIIVKVLDNNDEAVEELDEFEEQHFLAFEQEAEAEAEEAEAEEEKADE